MELRPVPRRAPMTAGIWVAVGIAIAAPVALLVLLPGVLGMQRYVAAGHAMDGAVGRGSLIFARRTPVTDLRRGDVISFVPPAPYAEQGMVTRRVVRLEPGGVRTMADSTHRLDPWTLPMSDPAVSRMVTHVPWLGYPVLAVANRGMWILLATVPLAAVGVASGADVRRRRRTARDAVVIPLTRGPGDAELPPRMAPR